MRSSTLSDRTLLPGLLLVALLWPHAYPQAQYPGPGLTGSTSGENLRHAATATQLQASVLRREIESWHRRAASANYTESNLLLDLNSIPWQFQILRNQFNAFGQLVLQLGRPAANNALAELDAGLTIIEELLVFLDERYAAGTLDRGTVERTARTFASVMGQWDQQFQRSTARLNLVR